MTPKFNTWPQWLVNRSGERRVFASADDVPSGWMDPADFAKLDRDGDGVMGGSVKRKPGRPRKAAP